MNIIINTFCNLHCPYCFADDAKEEYGKNIMSLENFGLCLDWLKANKDYHLQIIGGEPTINPMFKEYCDLILKYNFFESVMFFTNGLFSDEICDYLISISDKIQLCFLFNVNDPKWLGKERYAQIRKNISKLYLKSVISMGINLYTPSQDYKYIIDLADEFAIGNIRFSLTIPNIKANLQDFKNHYEENKQNLLDLFKYAAHKHIRLYQDCNSIPLCFINKDDLIKLLKWYPDLLNKTICDKTVLDVAPDLKIYKCFAFTNPDKAPTLLEFKNYNDINHYFNTVLRKIKTAKLTKDCADCGTYLLKGQSCGCWKYRETNNC